MTGKIVQHRRGTNAGHAAFTGAEGEFTYNTTTKTVHAHDGSTPGGFPMAKQSAVDAAIAAVDAAAIAAVVKNVVGFQIFRASGVFVVPQNVHDVFVTLVGGGGGGAGSINGAPYSGGGGGGGGVVYRDRIAVIPGEPYSVQIGAGGSGGYGSSGGGTYANSNGTAGGITSFGSLLSVSGGGGGNCQPFQACGGLPGGAEFSSVGGSGDVSGESGGAGGGCLYAPSLSAGHSGVTGVLFGGGGSGGRGSIYSENGGNGGQGLCIIEWG